MTLPTLLLLLSACSTPAPTPSLVQVAPVVAPGPDVTATTRAKDAMKTLGTTLKGELMASMASGGPTAALDVCSSSAQSLTATVGRDRGVRVGRSSLRLRNPANAGPEWVTAWLSEQGERPAEGVTPRVTSATGVSGEPVVRVVAPIPVEAPCLICHGPAADRASDLAEALAVTYPEDAANGYALGDLRGAIWAEVPVVQTGLELELDGTRKWSLDTSTRQAMGLLQEALATAPNTVEDAHQSASALETATSAMIAGCEMTGGSHDQLHAFLGALFPAIEGLKSSSNLAEANERRGVLLALLVEFDAAFE